MDTKERIKMKKLKNKLGRYKALQISPGKWVDFAAGETKSVPVDTKFNSEAFELILKKAPTKKLKLKKKPKKKETKE
jgi:hypothetical protein|tara:strand:+ start:3564 stop:3794 length:231 start_codon:yes stop_codon:yes gene_type:complete